MTRTLDWLPARTLKQRLTSAGIGAIDLLRIVGWAVLNGRLVASGFCTIHAQGKSLSASERAIVSERLWHVFERVDPAFDRIDASAKSQFQRITRWDAGEFTWTLDNEATGYRQETWESVHFDRVSIESLIAELEDRSNASVLQDFEIDKWIRGDCTCNDIVSGWKEFRQTFGTRTGKRDPTFKDAWKRVKGDRGPGRPAGASRNL